MILFLIPSVSLARPPVGWQSTAEHPLHITTDWLWLKTVVMLKQPWHCSFYSPRTHTQTRTRIHTAQKQGIHNPDINTRQSQSVHSPRSVSVSPNHNHVSPLRHTHTLSLFQSASLTLTSIKNEFGDCTSLFSLCLRFSSSAG